MRNWYVVICKSIISKLRWAILHLSHATPNGVCCATAEVIPFRQAAGPASAVAIGTLTRPGNGSKAVEGVPRKTELKSNQTGTSKRGCCVGGPWGVAVDGDLFRPKPPSPTRLLLHRIQVISGAEALIGCISKPDVPCSRFTLAVLSSNRDCPVVVCRATPRVRPRSASPHCPRGHSRVASRPQMSAKAHQCRLDYYHD